LKHALSSFTEVTSAEDYNWPYAALPPQVLLHFDLPQCYAALQAKGLTTLEPWSATQGMD
jgi:hypothetical protein